MNITIDEELSGLIPPLTAEEYQQLEANIRADGCREPLVVWHEEGILLDGHNRYRICQEHNLEFDTREYSFASRDVVKEWIILNQFGRRNLTPFTRAELALKLEPLIAAKAKEKQRIGGEQKVIQKSGEPSIRTDKELAKLAGVSHDTIAKAKYIQEHADERTKERLRSGGISINAAHKEIRREVAREERAGQPLPRPLDTCNGKFHVLYADPPWRYDFSTSGTREIENQYETLEVDQICDLNVPAIAQDDSVLFLWATSPKLPEALRVMFAWGFTYKTCMVWVKDKIGMGYYARQRHELLLIGTKGSPPVPAPENRPDSVVEAPRGKHSQKPMRFYDLIEAMYPNASCVELFARQAHPKWFAWGNETL